MQEATAVDYKLEVVVIPVSDVDRSKAFYSEQLGFNVDVDNRLGDDFRNVQLTPTGSACSVVIGTGLTPGLQLVVADAVAARDELAGRGVAVSEIRHMTENGWADGAGGPWNTFFFVKDPDGNDWAVQEKPGA
jgi:catechol 2,3-dioxygenase-like lactoylglutathione lyase family enzyme